MICFKEFSTLSPVELELVFAWRNDERIRKHFINEAVGYDEHFAFAKSLKDDESKRYFLVFDDEKPIGVINFVSISKDECEFGIYQNPNLRGFGRILLSNLAHYAFNNLRVKRLVARALKDNEKAIRLFLGFGFTLTSQDERVVHFMMSAPAFSQMTGGGGATFATLENKHLIYHALTLSLDSKHLPAFSSNAFCLQTHFYALNSANFSSKKLNLRIAV